MALTPRFPGRERQGGRGREKYSGRLTQKNKSERMMTFSKLAAGERRRERPGGRAEGRRESGRGGGAAMDCAAYPPRPAGAE